MSDAALFMRGPVHGTKDAKKVAIGSGVGAVIETYDFIGFGTAAALYFGHAFFPGASPIAGTLASFATLGVGFAARPLGGILGGHLGDKLGRKPVLVASLIIMGLATFAIGLRRKRSRSRHVMASWNDAQCYGPVVAPSYDAATRTRGSIHA